MCLIESYEIVLIFGAWHFVILRIFFHFLIGHQRAKWIRCDIKWNYSWHMNILELLFKLLEYDELDLRVGNLLCQWSGSFFRWHRTIWNSIIYAQTTFVSGTSRRVAVKEFNKCCYVCRRGERISSLPWWTSRVESSPRRLLFSPFFRWIFMRCQQSDIVYVVLLDILSGYHHHNFLYVLFFSCPPSDIADVIIEFLPIRLPFFSRRKARRRLTTLGGRQSEIGYFFFISPLVLMKIL